MNILYVSHHFIPDIVAGSLRAYKSCKYLSKFNYNINLIASSKGNSLVSEDLFPIPENCKIHRVSGMHVPYLPAGYGYIKSFVKKGLKIIKEEPIDIIFATSPTISAAIAGYRLSKYSKLPLILELRDPWIRSFPSRKLSKGGSHISKSSLQGKLFLKIERELLNHASKIIVTNPEIIQEVRTIHPKISEKKFEVVYNSADIKKVKPKKFDKFTIFCSGVLYRERGIGSLIRSMQFLDKTQLLLAGFVPEQDMNYYKELISSLNLQDKVKFLGVLPPDKELYSIQLGSDILFAGQTDSKLNYNLPARIFEYMAAGKPILALAIEGSGLDNIILQKKCGGVIYSKDPKDIAKAINSLRDKKLAKKLGTAGKKAIEIEFNIQYQTKKLDRIFKKLIKNKAI